MERTASVNIPVIIIDPLCQVPHPLNEAFLDILIKNAGTSLVVQWLRIRLSMQGTWVQALVWEDPTCRGATKPVRHNY